MGEEGAGATWQQLTSSSAANEPWVPWGALLQLSRLGTPTAASVRAPGQASISETDGGKWGFSRPPGSFFLFFSFFGFK